MPLPKPPTKPATLLTSIPTPSASARPAAITEPASGAAAVLAPRPASHEQYAHRAGRPQGQPGRQPVRPGGAPRARRIQAAQRSAQRPQAARDRRRAKLFVVDTNVLMHDPTSLFRFEEHDVYLPMMTLEELDGHKKGMSEVARNARQVSRSLDSLVAACKTPIEDGIPLAALGNADAGGRLFFQTQAVAAALPASLPAGKADNQILGVVKALQDMHPGREVVLVSKDINMRIKARALGLPAEDYYNDKVLEDTDVLYTGVAPAAGELLEQARQGHGVVAARRLHVLPHHRSDRRRADRQPVRLPRRCAAVQRAGQGDPRQDGDLAGACATTRTPRTRSGASPRATASRASRSTC